ncbi:DNA alkylation repair protein [Salibacterium aidingense]|uniref:DNA alkylation repair protein n=1 Tax=Salibacterium aidingense TaxID=384933 RepID=UPI003BCEB11D
MADLKDGFSLEFIENFGKKVHGVYPVFETGRFVEDVTGNGWEDLAFKNRIRRISTVLGKYLPSDFKEALNVLYLIDEKCTGLRYLFFPDFVEVYGLAEENWRESMTALERFTKRSSAEFAVRAFILKDPERMMKQMKTWAGDPDEHVRRLASEGCRPRLPWGQALPMFKRNPEPVLPILEKLLDDSSSYVKKSVANNFNDIAKDNPDVVVEMVRKWKHTSIGTDWILRHGSRTLIRQANPAIMELFGYPAVETEDAAITMTPDELSIGEDSTLHYKIKIPNGRPVKVRIEYGIYFVKSRGNTSRKLFLLTDKEVQGDAVIKGERTHHWADLSTRKHYPGIHRIALFVNGVEAALTEIDLKEA